MDARETGRKDTVTLAPMKTEWRTTGKASIRKDELPREWEVKLGGGAGLDYLAAVKRLWG